jgi:hypothetical protein
MFAGPLRVKPIARPPLTRVNPIARPLLTPDANYFILIPAWMS